MALRNRQVILSLAGLILASCLAAPIWAQSDAVITTPPGWVLSYDEEFNGTKLDPTVWNVTDSPPILDLGVQYWSPDDVSVQDGYLRLRYEKRNYKNYSYTSGQVDMFRSSPFLYGRVEIRSRMPEGSGVWVRDGLQTVANSWPPGLDLPEYFGADQHSVAFGNFWSDTSGDNQHKINNYAPLGFDPSKWHVYALEWGPGSLSWYVDGTLCSTQTENVPAEPMAVILGTSVGSHGGDPSSNVWPQEHDVDYIRIYRQASLPPPVDAGGDQEAQLTTSATIDLSGLSCNPIGDVKTKWSKQSGPGVVTLDNPDALVTKAHFTTPGQYILRLSAALKAAVSSDSLAVLVDAPGTTVITAAADSAVEYGTENNSEYTKNNPKARNLWLRALQPPDQPAIYDWGLLRFSIAGVPAAGRVTLRMYGGLTHGNESNDVPMIVHAMDAAVDPDDTNWAARPVFGPQIATFAVVPHLYHNQDRWYEADVTSYIKAEKQAGHDTVDIAIVTVPSATQTICKFRSTKSNGNPPELVIASLAAAAKH